MNIHVLGRRSLGDCFERYAEWLATTRQYAERSKREYRDDVSGVIQYLEERCHIATAPSVQRRHLAGYLAHCAGLGHVASTRRRSVAAIRSFFAFLVQEGTLRYSPAERLLPPERQNRPPRVLAVAEYERLRRVAAGSPRDLALIETVLQTGLGLSEVSRIRVADVFLPFPAPDGAPPGAGSVRVAGRGRRARTVTLNTKACEALADYLAEREATGSPALFLTKFGVGIGPRGIENTVTKYCKEAGIAGASVHTLRHTMAVQMLRRGATPEIVGKALGHATTEAMAVYGGLARETMDAELQRGEL